MHRVVITGIGVISPLGDVGDLWDNLSNGISGAGEITYFDTSSLNVKIACELKGFSPLDYVSAQELKRMDMSSCYALAAADEAVHDANIDFNTIDKTKIGVVMGTGIGGLSSIEREYTSTFTDKKGYIPNPFFITKIISNSSSSFISLRYKTYGPSFSVSTACSSSLIAINNAYNLLQNDVSDIMITGGTEAAITPWGIMNFDIMRTLSRDNDDPKHASRPCDKNRNGFVMGEGAGVLVLETLEHALHRGVKIYAEILGCGMCSESYHFTSPNPDGSGILLSMKNALQNANLTPNDIDLLSLHSTSTIVGDVVEIKAVNELFKDNKNLDVMALKSMLGHSLGASGAIEIIGMILCMKNNIIPPTINVTNIDETCNFNLVTKKKNKTIKTAMKNAFGFGGHNASIILRCYK